MEESVRMKSESCAAFTIEVKDFPIKLSKAKLGEKMETSPVVISWSTFTIGVYLRGESPSAEDHISVFLFNESDWLVKATYKISVNDVVFGQSESSRTFYPRDNAKYPGWGFVQCIPQGRCVAEDLLDKKGSLTIKIELHVVDELIPAAFSERRKESSELRDKIDLTSDKVETLQRDLTDVKKMVRLILLNLREVECPLCLRKVNSSSINQCRQVGNGNRGSFCRDGISSLQGHKVCEDCLEQANAKDNNNKRAVCLLCNISELTKPTVLEKVMGHGASIFHF